MSVPGAETDMERRAAASRGRSGVAVLAMIRRFLDETAIRGVLSAPHQLSLLSKLTLFATNELAFQERPGLYPAHRTALLKVDLRRIAAECGLREVRVAYSGRGRIPGTALHYPAVLSRWMPRPLSDNVLVAGRRADG